MTLTELRYIIAVAREQHFGKAAEACHVSQPTLSVAVRKLEETLGVALFERNKHEVQLTPVGTLIVQQAQQILDEVALLNTLARQGKDQLAGPLRIGAIYTTGPYLFPQLISRLHQLAPHMPLVIEENYTAVLRERLINGQLDIIIISLPFSSPGIQTKAVYDEDFVVLLPKDHALSKHKTIDAKELNNENVMLLGEGHCFRDQVMAACPGCVPNSLEGTTHVVEGSSLETIRHMVATGMGVTVLPRLASIQPYYNADLLVTRPFTAPAPTRPIAIAWRKSFPRSKAIETLQLAIHSCGLSGVKFS